ncbi:MAG: hypothetical protein ABH821_01330 [archaeon]
MRKLRKIILLWFCLLLFFSLANAVEMAVNLDDFNSGTSEVSLTFSFTGLKQGRHDIVFIVPPCNALNFGSNCQRYYFDFRNIVLPGGDCNFKRNDDKIDCDAVTIDGTLQISLTGLNLLEDDLNYFERSSEEWLVLVDDLEKLSGTINFTATGREDDNGEDNDTGFQQDSGILNLRITDFRNDSFKIEWNKSSFISSINSIISCYGSLGRDYSRDLTCFSTAFNNYSGYCDAGNWPETSYFVWCEVEDFKAITFNPVTISHKPFTGDANNFNVTVTVTPNNSFFEEYFLVILLVTIIVVLLIVLAVLLKKRKPKAPVA